MVKSGLGCFVLIVFVLGALAAQAQRSAGKSNQVVLKYLGTAGWEIADGTTAVLIDRICRESTDRRHQEEGRATPWLATPARRMGGVILPRPMLRQSIRISRKQILSWSLTRIMTTFWMFLTSPSKRARW